MPITLAEYNRRWDLIMEAFRQGIFTRDDASAAVRDLTRTGIDHHR
jgi:hypothetical protein